jgi:hypothetical protein
MGMPVLEVLQQAAARGVDEQEHEQLRATARYARSDRPG